MGIDRRKIYIPSLALTGLGQKAPSASIQVHGNWVCLLGIACSTRAMPADLVYQMPSAVSRHNLANQSFLVASYDLDVHHNVSVATFFILAAHGCRVRGRPVSLWLGVDSALSLQQSGHRYTRTAVYHERDHAMAADVARVKVIAFPILLQSWSREPEGNCSAESSRGSGFVSNSVHPRILYPGGRLGLDPPMWSVTK